MSDWLDEFFEGLRQQEIVALKRAFDSPSPAAQTVADLSANAVLIDRAGKRREYWMPDFRPEYLIPIPTRCRVTFSEEPPMPLSFPVARFQLSSVIDGRAVYRQATR